MALYKVDIRKPAFKELQSIDRKIIPHIWQQIKKLAENPRPMNSVKLWGTKLSYRIRIGNYRVVYQIDEHIKTVTVYRINHRKEVYR